MISSGPRGRALGVLVVALACTTVAARSWDATAQTPGLLPTTTTTSSTSTTAPPADEASSTTTTTTTAQRPPILGPTTTTSTSTTSTTAPADAGQSPPPAPPTAGDGGAAPSGAGPFPAELQALMNSITRSAANNTKALLAALAPLQQYGLTETQAAVVGFGRFPIAGLASYSHDWWFPRFGPGWRLHEGTDIFAAHGTPVRAPVDGVVRTTTGGLGGISVYVVQPDGTYWYLAHLAATRDDLTNGAAVKTGDVVGFVGNTGNAAGGPPHVHLQIHPGGGGPIDPKAVLDQFIADAVALAPRVVEAYANAARAGSPPVRAPAAPEPAVNAALPRHATLLWTAAVNPPGGVLQFATDEAAHAADSIDWSTQATSSRPSAFERRLARQYAVWWVTPLVHPRLARLLAV